VAGCNCDVAVHRFSSFTQRLSPQRERDGYVIAGSESAKLARLLGNYGIELSSVNFVNSVNSAGDMEQPPEAPEPRII